MPYYHCTLYFSWQTAYSWVEQFWRQAPDRAEALAATLELARGRFKILGAGATISRVRVCQADLPRACASAGLVGSPLAAPADMPIAALEVKLTSSATTRHWRNYPLRGLPLAWYARLGSRSILSAAYQPQVDAWLSLLVNRQWLLQVEQAIGPAQAVVTYQLAALSQSDIYADPLDENHPPAGSCTVVAFADQDLPVGGDLVAVRGAMPSPASASARRRINGTHPILLTAGNTVRWLGDLAGAVSAAGGAVEIRSLAYLPISDWVYRRRVGRKCGPFTEAGEVDVPNLPVEPVAVLPRVRIDVVGQPSTLPLPVFNTYTTLQDIAVEIFKGYTTPTTPSDPLIGIAQRANTVNVEYAVFLGGVDLHIEKPAWQQYLSALASLVGTTDEYTSAVRATVVANTPDGCGLHIFGHSAGGMTAQWLSGLYPAMGNRVIKTLIGFGTAWIVSTKSFLEIKKSKLFMIRADPVPYMGPGGWATPPRALLVWYSRGESEVALDLLQLAIPLGQTVLDGDDVPLNELVTRHNCYPTLPDCLNYYWDGDLIPDRRGALKEPLHTSIVRRFLYPS